MGMVEYIMRVALHQSDETEFFPLSLIVAGIGLYVALTATPKASPRQQSDVDSVEAEECFGYARRYKWEKRVAALSVWLAVSGAVVWVYLLAASFSPEVKTLLPYYPLSSAGVFYLVGAALTEWKARGRE
jgi:sterol desaturase/sphingolipid hydroxylase (fatty acid hydroxylase superfamily)